MMRLTSLFLLPLIVLSIMSCSKPAKNLQHEQILADNWQLQNSDKTKQSGDKISTAEFQPEGWYDVKMPATVLHALIQNGVYKDVYYAKNLEEIPTKQFTKNWWYRTEFNIADVADEENTRLVFEGINYKANIWLNGQQIANSKSVEGAFNMFDFDVTKYVKKGKNVLAVEIIPPVKGDLTIGFVDWNPWAPDNNMGIWRNVKLRRTNAVSVNNVFVRSEVNVKTLKEASVIVSAELKNHSDKKTTVTLKGKIENIEFSQDYTLNPKEERLVEVTEKECPALKIQNPRLWWPVNLGEPNLYNLSVTANVGDVRTDAMSTRFGIREVSQYINEEGHKGYNVNGKKVLIRGGGWVDDIMLSDTPEKVEAQIKYTKHMNLNTIRLEGFWGNDKTIYEKADEHGILLMIGWSCHWEWEGYCGRKEDKFMSIFSEYDMNLQSKGYRDQVVWLRNHPSVFLWVYGSDKLPSTELERKLNAHLEQVDQTRPILASCKYWDFGTDHYNISEISGPAGVKMLGPYGYVTPNYWYVDTTTGGAWGFNTETGPGPQVPPIESIKRMIPEKDLWPINDMWDYHCGRNEFQTLKRYLKAFNARYGEAQSAEEFAYKSQISNYEAIRPMFEAFAVNKYNATGVIQWMLNSAWPEMFWQLYDWYLMPNGAFYGTKKACQPLNLVYHYGDQNLYLTNEYNEGHDNLTAEIKVLDINSNVVFTKEIKTGIDATSSKKILDFPKIDKLSSTYFLDMRLKDGNGNELISNFYWLSTQEDVCDFENAEWFITPNKEYADLTALNTMPKADVNASHKFTKAGDEVEVEVSLENKSDKLAFFIELQVKGQKSGQSILPIFWDDNYVSLLPGEKRVVKGRFSTSDLGEDEAVFSFEGFNLK